METNTLNEDESPTISIEDCQEIVNSYMQREKGTEEIEFIQIKGGQEWLINSLKTSTTSGISENSIPVREEKYGSNRKTIVLPKTWCQFAIEALEDFMLRILIVAGIVSIIVDQIMHPEDRAIAWIEGFAILLAVTIIVIVTASSNLTQEREFISLNIKAEAGKVVTIIRSGIQLEDMNIDDVQVGDLVSIKSGMENPADAIVVEGFSVLIDESSVTGESKPMTKCSLQECQVKLVNWTKKNPDKTLKLHDIPSPVILAGTKILNGSGKMLIINVGPYSAIGKIKEIVESAEEELTPLQMKLENIARDISFFGLGAAVLLFVVLILRWVIESSIATPTVWSTQPAVWHVNVVLQALLMGITVLVVAIPEGLPLAVMLSLSFSVGKMMEENNLVRKLEACETMGSANIICSDKTGTLTKNEMFFTDFWCGSEHQVYDSIKGQILAIDNFVHEKARDLFLDTLILNSLEDPNLKKGNPTEMALLKYAKDAGVDVLARRNAVPKLFQATFSSDRKRMSTILKLENGNTYVFIKGASEFIIEISDFFHNLETNVSASLTTDQKSVCEKVIETMAKKALRTIGLAYKQINLDQVSLDSPDEHGIHEYEKSGFQLIGICGIKDVIRPEVPASIIKCYAAGIQVKMVTGDNKLTAYAIAKEVGIINPSNEKYAIVMEGPEFLRQIGGICCDNCRDKNACDCVKNEEELKIKGNEDKKIKKDSIKNKEAFDALWKNLCVLSRSRPEDKYALVTGLKERDNVVAVTGDGTNDAPALSKASVGFAMNIAGTEVAKHAADILLMDDNFASIVVAVKWGRNIYASIQKFLQLQLTVNFVAVIMTIISAVSVEQAILSTVQMLWINLIMDTLAALALATEPPSEELLNKPPVNKNDYIITLTMIKHIIGQTIYQLAVLLVFMFAGHLFLFDLNGRQTQPDSILIWNGFTKLGWSDGKVAMYGKYTVHAAYNFNVFIMMTFCNFFNCRILDDSFNIFHRVHRSTLLIIILSVIFGLQIILLTFTGPAIRVVQWGLGPAGWALCIGFGMITWIVRALLLLIPTQNSEKGIGNKEMSREILNRGSLLSLKKSHDSNFYKRKESIRRGSIRLEGSARQISQLVVRTESVKSVDKRI